MIIRNRKPNMTLIELVAGVAVYMVLGSLIFAMLLCLKAPVEQWLGSSVASIIGGFFEGGVISVLMVIHMAKSVEESILLNEKEALKHTRIMYIVRTIIGIGAVIARIAVGVANVVSMLAGLFGLKLSAYIQPVTHKCIARIRDGRQLKKV